MANKIIAYMKISIVVIGFVSIIGGVVYGSFKVYRHFNWKFGYQDKVVETINGMVKEECLVKDN